MMFDPIYWIMLAVIALISGIAALLVKSRFAAAREVPIGSGLTGAEVAAAILRQTGIDDVQIVEHQGFLSDHYNPVTKTLALSPDVYHGRHAAAAGVAAHEVGHAIQHAHAYLPLQMRSMLVPMASIGSNLGPWLVIIGIALGAAAGAGAGFWVAWTGIGLFGCATAFSLITLPVEFDASARAKVVLADLNLIRSQEEADQVRGVLTAAGLTYVAAAIGAILQLLYWVMVLTGGRRED